jgi:Kef-type K+ transport system membrane component KefB
VFESPSGSLLLILAAAFLAPLISSRFPKLHLPALVFEILLGMLIGPEVLGLVKVTPPIELLAEIGLATLIFLAGFELEFDRVRGRPMKLAVSGWFLSVVIALAVAAVLLALNVIAAEMYVAFALTTTALGTLLPILHDEGLLPTPFGAHVLAIGSVGEFLPIIAIALLLGSTNTGEATIALVAFAVVAVVAVAYAARSPKPSHLRNQLGRTLRSSGQLYIRLALLTIALLTFLASELGLDMLLGAFIAGIVYRLYTGAGAPQDELAVMETKLEAVSFGYVVPIFFVVTGVTFDLSALATPTALLKIPLFVLALLLVRGIPVLLYRKDITDRRSLLSLAFLSATGLPLIVAITTIGVNAGEMRSSTAAALVGAGMISVILFPLFGLSLAPKDRPEPAPPSPSPDPAVEL